MKSDLFFAEVGGSEVRRCQEQGLENPKPLNPKPLNPKPLNPKALKGGGGSEVPRFESGKSKGLGGLVGRCLGSC